MKVVLFCGGLGMRLRDYSEIIPKPMVNIGYRPILWHVMKYYAHYGHKEFILCLGYKADVIKDYFLNYNEYLSNDFVLTKGGKDLDLLHSDIDDWKITFVDTGLTTSIGQRLRAVQKHVGGEEMFLANYADGLSDCPLPILIDTLRERGKTAIFSRPGQGSRSTSFRPSTMASSRTSWTSRSPRSGSTGASSFFGEISSTTSAPGRNWSRSLSGA